MALYLWGSGYENQLGVEKQANTDVEAGDMFKDRWIARRPLRLDLCGARATDVACGEAHTLVCTEFGEAWAGVVSSTRVEVRDATEERSGRHCARVERSGRLCARVEHCAAETK